MKGLYQLLSEDYREYQLKEPIRRNSKRLIESTRPSKLKKKESLKESLRTSKLMRESAKRTNPIKTLHRKPFSEADKAEKSKKSCDGEDCKDKEVIKGAEKEKKPLVKEDEKVKDDEKVEEVEITEEPIEDPTIDGMGEGVPEEKEPTALEKISTVANLSKEEIEAEMAEMTDEEKEAIKSEFETIKNVAMDLFPEEVEEDKEEIKEEVPVDEEPLEECEISSFKVTRIAPKFGAVMIEAQTKEGLKYITGKNFNESEKTLDEAEIVTDKISAANRFKSLLK